MNKREITLMINNGGKKKKYVVSVMAALAVMTCLSGCSKESELLQMINNGDMIEIEVATPINQEQGEESTLSWEQLASLTTNPDLRKEWDNTLNITSFSDGKNGVLYVNPTGENEPNNTLRVALHNREFIKALENKDTVEALANAAELAYTDIDATENQDKALYIALNGYFNLLPDSEDGASYADDALSRREFMAMVARSELQVDDSLVSSDDFNTLVGESEYNAFAEQVASDSYLDINSKSLNNKTYNGTMTRAEAIYLIVNRYFKSDLESVDLTTATFTDCKDGGDIATEQKFIENGTEKDYCRDYELVYATQNPDNGVPTSIYKAMVVAQNRGLITKDTRWDEGITKYEATKLLVEALKQETGIQIFTYDNGSNVQEPTVDMNSTDIDPAAQDADSTFIESASTSEETKEETNSENPFMGMTREELEKVDCSNFSDKELDDYLEAYQSTEPKHGKISWTGKPFEEMTQDELNEIDSETLYNLTDEDKQRWLDRYNETIAEKVAAETQQNQNSGNTAPAEEHWEVEIELGPIEPSDIKCY